VIQSEDCLTGHGESDPRPTDPPAADWQLRGRNAELRALSTRRGAHTEADEHQCHPAEVHAHARQRLEAARNTETRPESLNSQLENDLAEANRGHQRDRSDFRPLNSLPQRILGARSLRRMGASQGRPLDRIEDSQHKSQCIDQIQLHLGCFTSYARPAKKPMAAP